jgi:hypothetical protein
MNLFLKQEPIFWQKQCVSAALFDEHERQILETLVKLALHSYTILLTLFVFTSFSLI